MDVFKSEGYIFDFMRGLSKHTVEESRIVLSISQLCTYQKVTIRSLLNLIFHTFIKFLDFINTLHFYAVVRYTAYVCYLFFLTL